MIYNSCCVEKCDTLEPLDCSLGFPAEYPISGTTPEVYRIESLLYDFHLRSA